MFLRELVRVLMFGAYPMFAVDPNEGGDDEGVETVGTGNEARLAMLNRINDANDKERAEELMDVNDDGTVVQFVAENLSDEEQAAREAAIRQDEDGTVKKELDRAAAEANGDVADAGKEGTAGQAKVKIKVNGKEMELTQDELIARAQKVESADQYLVDAAKLRRDAEASRVTEIPVKEEPASDGLEDRRALVRAIQMGTEEEAMAAIEKLQMRNRPTVDQDSIARTIDERLTFKEAAHRFESEYPDILGDDMLRDMALRKDQELLAKGDKRGYWERYDEIGKGIREWKDTLIKSAATKVEDPKKDEVKKDETVSLDQKQQRKASVTPIPKAAAVKAPRADADEEDKPESVGDVIAKMAEARGGTQRLRT
jgi:hypothetical protein